MILDIKEFTKLLEEIKSNPEKKEEILQKYQIFHSFMGEDDGIPPRFGKNFRTNGPIWEKVTGIDFDSIGRILVCHLCIEHYITNLIELSCPSDITWEASKISFSQKLNLIKNLKLFKGTDFIKGLQLINKIRNRLSHNLNGEIGSNEVTVLKNILIDQTCKKKGESEKLVIIKHFKQFGNHAIIDRFTAIFCAFVAGHCTKLINKKSGISEYYKLFRNE